jgi:hypothetical protein
MTIKPNNSHGTAPRLARLSLPLHQKQRGNEHPGAGDRLLVQVGQELDVEELELRQEHDRRHQQESDRLVRLDESKDRDGKWNPQQQRHRGRRLDWTSTP